MEIKSKKTGLAASLLVVAAQAQTMKLGQIKAELSKESNLEKFLRPNLDYEQQVTAVEKEARLYEKQNCSEAGDSLKVKEDLPKIKERGLDEFKSIKVMQRDLRDWNIKAFRESYYNDTAKKEDNGDFMVTDLEDGNICLSSKNGYQSLKFKSQSEPFSPWTT